VLNQHIQKILLHGGMANSPTSLDYESLYGSPDSTITSFPSTEPGVQGADDVLIAIDANISSTDDGILIEFGGSNASADTSTGLVVGVNNGTLRARAFSSGFDSAFNSDSAAAFVEADILSYTGTFCTYYVVIDASAFTLKVYVQSGGKGSSSSATLLGSGSSDGTQSIVYGGNTRGYGQIGDLVADLGAAYEVTFTGTIDEIRYWSEGASQTDFSGFPASGLAPVFSAGFAIPSGAGAPSYVGATSTNDASTLSLTGITGLAEGDVVIFFCCDDNGADQATVTSSEWTQLWTSGSDIVSTAAIKEMGATVDTSISITRANEVLTAIAFRNVSAADYAVSTESLSSGNQSTFNSVTVSQDNSVVVLAAGLDDDQGSTVTGVPTGYTLAVEEQGASKESGALCYKLSVTSGTESPSALTWSSTDATIGYAIALQSSGPAAKNAAGFQIPV